MCIATLALVGAGIGAAGQVMNGIAQGNAASYQAKVAQNNAIIEKQNAAYAASAGAAQTEQSGLAERGRQAKLRAGIAANGLDVNTGTPADLQTSSRELGLLDTQTVSNNAAKQAYGYEAKSTGYSAQAQLDEAQAGFAPIAGVIGAAGTLLSNPSVDSGISGSLLSSNPSVGSNFQWMQLPSSVDTGVLNG
jgi:hypothetical protein